MDKYLSTQDKIEYILPGDKVAKWACDKFLGRYWGKVTSSLKFAINKRV
jgi:hypothetical protein